MLGKLIKYDLKSVSWLLIPLHLLVIGASILARIALQNQIYELVPNALLLTAIGGYIIIFVVVSYVTAFMIVYRFYKNLFSDEGYLSMTLPVTPGQHLLSKTINGVIWSLIDYAVMIGSLAIVFFIPVVLDNKEEFIAEMDKALEMSSVTFWSATLLLGLLSCVSNVIFYYLCITLGQLFSKHRVIAAIIIYFALSALSGILSIIVMLIIGLMPMTPGFTSFFTSSSGINAGEVLMHTYITTAVFSIIETIIAYIVTYYIMNKKINLE